jgi:hypothetical protein
LPEQLQQYIRILKRKVITNIAYVNLQFAAKQHLLWRKGKSRNIEHLDAMISYVKRADAFIPETYASALSWSIYHFAKSRNITQARKAVAGWASIEDATWAFNEAFLLAFEGKLREATRFYKIAFRRNSDSRVLLEIEEFLEWVLSENPGKPQIYYCLGLINYFGKEEYKIAKEDFDKFIFNTNIQQFKEQRNLAKKYIDDINNKLNKT